MCPEICLRDGFADFNVSEEMLKQIVECKTIVLSMYCLLQRFITLILQYMSQAFKLALEAAGGASAESTIFFDDSTRNIAAGSKFGLYTVLVGRQGADIGAQMEVPNKP